MIKKTLLILFFAAFSSSFAQEVTFDSVKKLYENFKYDEMLKESDLLIGKGALSDSLLIELHLMRSNVFYQNGSDQLTRNSFESILTIRRNFIPDPTVTSPKLIAIFNEVKFEFIKKNPDLTQQADSTAQLEEIKFREQVPQTGALLKNMILPGLGQIHHNNPVKGWINSAASILNLGILVYYAADANKKQNIYLNETNQNLIQKKYDDYNKSFKLRNTFIITYAAIWLYSQIDLIFFTEDPELSNPSPVSGLLDLTAPGNGIQLSFRIQF
ncbi:MAG: hypothetical protein WC061_03115 [Melioribacteraceae bacterium]